ncbi:MAG: hydroxymethylglutaryl-CoA lyase [Flavobacteriales bacterium]
METKQYVKITECPRDAMQGIKTFIPTEEKVSYLNKLLKCGFDRLDFGSFVSPKAIPQMADTAALMPHLELNGVETKLLAIIANAKGAEDASQFDEIAFLGYPFSVSETFQLRNTNATIAQSLERVKEIQNIALKHDKKLLVYLSMAFGNPYGDPWSAEIVEEHAKTLNGLGIQHLALADTTGISNANSIHQLFTTLIPSLPDCEISAHLHAALHEVQPKMKTALEAGCRSFDGAINGIGGCPMASDELTGNMETLRMLSSLDELSFASNVDKSELADAALHANYLFAKYGN